MILFRPVLLTIAISLSAACAAQKFVHPGIDQTAADLAYMRLQVQRGEQPWKDAFGRMKAETDLGFPVEAFAHVMRGPYGKPNIGGGELSKSAQMAYRCALMWAITNEKPYADKAIEILGAWSRTLWDFDYNDAKLLAGWTGHYLCNAAEILRYTPSGWQRRDVDAFTEMLMTVYYPLMRFYYPQANGNWDGAIIHSILAIAIFTDNRLMFDNAVGHFLYAPVNGSLFKYIYPNGQCQETARDQAHVQLGLGEFAGAARVAYTQGVDLFSAGDFRLALGYEFTAGVLLGERPFSYGRISERAMVLRDDYEYVYRHYAAMGVDMPNTRRAADAVRASTTMSTLTAFRAPGAIPRQAAKLLPSGVGFPAGALKNVSYVLPGDAIRVAPGESLQEALNAAAGTGRWVVALAGLHTLPTTLRIPGNITLAGEGVDTKIFLDPASGVRDAIVNASDDMRDVVIRDLVVEGSTRPEPPNDPNSARSYRNPGNRGGIMFLGTKEGQMKNIRLINITVQNCTFNGVFISGAADVEVSACDFSENGSSVVPGPRLQHNLLLTHVAGARVTGSRLGTSPFGCGVALAKCSDAGIRRCEIARNGYYGVLVTESSGVTVSENLIEAGDRSAVMVEFLYAGSRNVTVSGNTIQYNNGHGVEAYAAKNIEVISNKYISNRLTPEKISQEKNIIMDEQK